MRKVLTKLFFVLCTFLLISITLSLTACASSDLSRQGEASIDRIAQSTNGLGDDDINLADDYQNSSQASKGILIGGITGAITGALAGAGSTAGAGPGAAFGAAAGIVLGGLTGAIIDAHANTNDRLINRGVNVIVLGDQILIVIPSARIFDPYSARINPSAHSTLALVSRYMNRYVKMLVKVSVYTAGGHANELSQRQANSLVRFFVANGLNARVLYADGRGNSHSVVCNTKWDSDNYRIEITLEKLYV